MIQFKQGHGFRFKIGRINNYFVNLVITIVMVVNTQVMTWISNEEKQSARKYKEKANNHSVDISKRHEEKKRRNKPRVDCTTAILDDEIIIIIGH